VKRGFSVLEAEITHYTMKTKEQKKEAVQSLAATLPKSSITLFTTFARAGEPGLSVSQMQAMKRALRAGESEYLVVKKTLLDKALAELKYDGVDVFGMDGSTGLVLGHGDVYAVTKALYKFAKEFPALKVFGGWMDGRLLTRDEVLEMATLPSRDELIARLLGMMKSPLSQLAIVLGQIEKQKAGAGQAVATA
jgi:large subunit ribosomal protein L10